MTLRAIYLSTLIFLNSIYVSAQSKGDIAAAGVAAAVSIGVAAFQVNQIVEMWELAAAEYVLDSKPDINEFRVKLNKPFSNAKKWNDVSSLSVLSFNVTFSKFKNPDIDEKQLLIMFLDDGYMTEYGINLSLVKWKFISKTDWEAMLKNYLHSAVGYDVLEQGELMLHNKIKSKKDLDKYDSIVSFVNPARDTILYGRTGYTIPLRELYIDDDAIRQNKVDGLYLTYFQKIDGDTYIRRKYNEEFQLIYNEGALGIYLNETGKLVQFSRGLVNDINRFFYY